MTATAVERQTERDAARYVAAYQAFAGNGGGRAPAWLRELRDAGIARFAAVGFPSTREERWRFTNVEPIARGGFALAEPGMPAGAHEAVQQVALGEPAARLLAVYVNGRFAPELSSVGGAPKGVVIDGLAAAVERQPDLVRQHLGRHAAIDGNPFVALSAAFMADGAFVHVPRNVVLDQPIQLVFVSTGGPSAVVTHPRNLIVAEENAQASVVEQYVGIGSGSYWTNAVTELVLGPEAVVNAYRVQREREDAFHTATTQSAQQRGSVLTSVTLVFGARLARHDINASLSGEAAECTLNGLLILRDEQHADHHTTLEHAKPYCPSWEVFNGVFDDRSRGVFNGRIIVRPGAQRTDSKQTSNNLLLSENARADSQPQLEIYADDVKCTHGATLGPIDPNAMFYLRSRGLDEEVARNLLTYGFGAEILNSIADDALRAQLDGVVQQRLAESLERRIRR
jgi:Fe-S cluster assembly protein SufD